MATLVRLTKGQIDDLFDEAEQLERVFKEFHAELESLNVPQATLNRFTALHGRYTSAIAYLERQRELAEG